MEDKDFDNIFGDKLKEQKDFSFSEQKWTVLERQYDQLLAEDRYKKLLLFGSILLLALLSSLFWTLSSLSKTNKKLDDLTNEIRLSQPSKKESDTPSVYRGNVSQSDGQNQKSDTTFHKIVVYRFDTIYQTVIKREVFQPNIGGLENKKQTSIVERLNDSERDFKEETNKIAVVDSNIFNKKTELATAEGLKEKQPIPEHFKTINSAQGEKKDGSAIEQKDSVSEKEVLGKTTPPLSINADTASKSDGMSFEKELKKEESKKLPIIDRIKFKGYEVGIASGGAFINNSNIVHQAGYSVGLKGGALLGRGLHLIGEVQGLNLNFETERFDDKLNIPAISPPTTNDDLSSVNVSHYYWQLALGLKYQFMDGKRWQPYLSASIVGQASSDEELDYKFVNRLTKGYTIIKYKRRGDDFETGIFRTTAGVNYRIWRKLHGFLEGSYDFELGKSAHYNQIGQVKLGLSYRF